MRRTVPPGRLFQVWAGVYSQRQLYSLLVLCLATVGLSLAGATQPALTIQYGIVSPALLSGLAVATRRRLLEVVA